MSVKEVVEIDRDTLEEIVASFELMEEDSFDHGYYQLRVWRSRWSYLSVAVRDLKEALCR